MLPRMMLQPSNQAVADLNLPVSNFQFKQSLLASAATGKARLHTAQIRFQSAGGAQPIGRFIVASSAIHFPLTLASR